MNAITAQFIYELTIIVISPNYLLGSSIRKSHYYFITKMSGFAFEIPNVFLLSKITKIIPHHNLNLYSVKMTLFRLRNSIRLYLSCWCFSSARIYLIFPLKVIIINTKHQIVYAFSSHFKVECIKINCLWYHKHTGFHGSLQKNKKKKCFENIITTL